jgi:hypothetical protein
MTNELMTNIATLITNAVIDRLLSEKSFVEKIAAAVAVNLVGAVTDGLDIKKMVNDKVKEEIKEEINVFDLISSDEVDDKISTAVSEGIEGIDLSGEIEDRVESAINDLDIEDKISDAIGELELNVEQIEGLDARIKSVIMNEVVATVSLEVK